MSPLPAGLEEELHAEVRPRDLDAALARVLMRVRLLAKRRIAWLRHLWSDEVTRPHSNSLLAVGHAEVDGVLNALDQPEAEAAWLARHGSEFQKPLEAMAAAMASDRSSRFALLHQIFGLDRKDSDLLQVCLALALDPGLERVYAYVQDRASRTFVTEELAARLCGHGLCGTWNADSPLFRWDLITRRDIAPAEPASLACDPMIRNWLLGISSLDENLVACSRLVEPLAPLPGWPAQKTADWIRRVIGPESQGHARVWIKGPAGSGRKNLAAAIAGRLGLTVLGLDADVIPDDHWHRTFVHAQRQAYLDRTALAWEGESLSRRPWPGMVPGFPIQFVILDQGQTIPSDGKSVENSIHLPELTSEERLVLWKAYVPASAAWPPASLNDLALRFRVSAGGIAGVAAKQPASADEAAGLVREQVRERLGKLAQHLECPFSLEDLVVAEPVRQGLNDFIFEARERPAFWEQPGARRLFPQGRGLMALFSGPSGTGKTMAAQIIAACLGLDLFRIDLSAVVSKYVGETSQNLERILSRAEGMDVVLFFDEADALFGKRTEIKDAHDRFANTDTNYLLQAIENYQGIAILATNQKGQLDTAFIRRIRFLLEFNRPDESQRLLIWQKMVAELAGAECLKAISPSLARMARELDVTGAQIKYAVLSGLFIARRQGRGLELKHLLAGLERELMKEGRAFSERDWTRMLET